jgi:hypothetical protein
VFADIFTNAPVQFDQFLVAGSNDVVLSGLDEGKDFGELRLQFICHKSRLGLDARNLAGWHCQHSVISIKIINICTYHPLYGLMA